jgi:trehalose/maltose transport system substrate-binding protein
MIHCSRVRNLHPWAGPAARWRPFHIVRSVSLILSLLVVGCSGQSSPQPVTLTYLDVEWDTPDKMPALAKDLEDFTKETGIQVKRLPRPDGSLNQLVLWRELLKQGPAGPDVVSIDVVWSGILNQYLLDLKPYFAADLPAQGPAVLSSYTVGDKVVAMPHHAYIAVLYYRPQLLHKYGYREPPKTWDELEKMAARIQAGERAKGNKDFWGYVWQGGINEDLTCTGLEWQISEDGGQIIENNRTISVNNPQAIRTWQRAARWVGSISPPSVAAYEKWDSQNAWGSGKAAFLRGWQSDFSLTIRSWPFSEPGSQTSGDNAAKFGVTSLPSGKAARVGTLGGNGLAVSQSSAHPRESLELIRFLMRRDAQLMRANQHSEPSSEVELFELPPMLKAFPQLAQLREHGAEVVSRPSIVAGEKYEEVSRAYIRAVHSVLAREKIPAVAAADLEKELVTITGFRPGPPPALRKSLGGKGL